METAPKPRPSFFRSSSDLIVLLVGLALTFFAWRATNQLVDTSKHSHFLSDVDVLELQADSKIGGYLNALTGLKGLYSASTEVERDEFSEYIHGLDVTENYPGLYGFAYVSRVADSETQEFLDNLELGLKEAGVSEKVSRQLAEGPEHYIVNFRALHRQGPAVGFGYDLLLDETRAKALLQARDSGQAVASGPILLQGPEKPGFIITIPIYLNGQPTSSIEERREALSGFVNAAFLYDELFADVYPPEVIGSQSVHLFDENELIYDAATEDEHDEGLPIQEVRDVEIAGRTWKLHVNLPTLTYGDIEGSLPVLVLLAGTILSFLSFGLTYSLSSSRARAEALAEEMTKVVRSERDRVELIVSSMGEAVLAVDQTSSLSLINTNAQKLLEIEDPRAVIGRNWSELVTTLKGEKKVPLKERSFSEALAKGVTIVTTLEEGHYYQTKSGRVFPIASITAPLVFQDKVVGAAKIFRDATHEKEEKSIIENKVKERTRQLSEEQAKMIASINSVPRGFIILDTEGKIILTNSVLWAILGIKGQILNLVTLDKTLSGVFNFSANYKKCFSEGRPIKASDLEYGTKFLEIYLAPIYVSGPSKVSIGVVVTVEDITERKVIERSRDEFFSIASHELRTPLTAIMGNSSMILDHYKDQLPEGDLKEMIDDIHSGSLRLIDIVNDFLETSRLEMGRIEFKKVSFDVTKTIEQAISELDVTSSRKKLYLRFDKPKTKTPNVIGDEERARQILVNLLGNAMKFTQQGGISVSIATEAKFVKVIVTDTGVGIAPSQQSLLFRKFQQAGESLYSRDTTKGTGLGLYISKLLVERMGGQIKLESSKVNAGSSFSFSLPAA